MLQDLCPAPLVALPYVTTQRYSSSRTYVIKMTSSANDAWSPVVTEEVTFDELPVSNRLVDQTAIQTINSRPSVSQSINPFGLYYQLVNRILLQYKRVRVRLRSKNRKIQRIK